MSGDVLAVLVFVAALTPPPCRLEDARRFPPPAYIRQAVNLNKEYQAHLGRLILWREQSGRDCSNLREALDEARHLLIVYDSIGGGIGYDGPQEPGPGATEYRLRWLNSFRELVGEEAYWSAELPPPVPCWRFAWTR